MHRGVLRIYLGAAPGVGKTYAMLDEGRRRSERGTDVVAALIETHGRSHTAAQIGDLEVVPRRPVTYRGATFQELDVGAVLARRPEVALVDELAHSNVPGAAHVKRWQDVQQLLDAGIDVISTVNVQHLESLNDVVEAITGVAQHETVPDTVVRAAEQIELVDMTPEALRRRMAHGNVYGPERIDAALGNYFRPGNLTALRELALLWLADRVDEGLQRYREAHGIGATWETRERVVIALTGGPEGEALIRRGARIAARVGGGDLLAVHIARSDGLAGTSIAALNTQRLLVESLGGSFHSVVGDDVPAALLAFARAKNATQVVIGASRRGMLASMLTGPGTGATIARASGSIDVHLVSHDFVGRGRVLPKVTGGLTARRRLGGLLIGLVSFGLLVPICAAYRADLTLPTDLLLFLLAVVACSLIGGFYPALLAAVVAGLLLNYYFVPPIHRFTISAPQNAFALLVFVIIAVLVSHVVDVAARRTVEAARSSAEAETLSTLAGSLLRGEQALPALLERVQETFAVSSVTLLCRSAASAPDGSPDVSSDVSSAVRGGWTIVAGVGPHPSERPSDGDAEAAIGAELSLVLRGRRLGADDQRVLSAFATEVAVAYEQRRLAAAAAAVAPLAEVDRTRTALLNSVSHDLRTPIAIAKAAVTSLRSDEVQWSPTDRRELLADADAALDRLTDLVTNLLDLSRLQAGALAVNVRPVGLDDVVSRALDHASTETQVDLDVPALLPEVLADPGLLERVVANLIENAIRYSPADQRVRVTAGARGEVVELRVVDAGPGIPPDERAAVFAPFRRRGDDVPANGAGVGLGLAIAQGFIHAMRGRLELEDTPGGGLTAVVVLPQAPSVSTARPAPASDFSDRAAL